ncbi:Z1 domain-containing protein [Pedobacter caeni]|uniref:Z1 domain-containing protein n=1 Tax=Pedobacter caeni TaxID=288992 RepID=A0A1M5JPA1_9SPHI|nr:Z1 domain-containing protein [Pedobacter caeni]SHG42110.1 Z1 domain-containing protein [Pedobacter caeni]
MNRHYNAIKSIVKDAFELFKTTIPYPESLNRAIFVITEHLDVGDIIHPSAQLISMKDLENLLFAELQYEVNTSKDSEGGEYQTLTDESGHTPWYRDKVSDDRINFVFWKRYKKYLLNIKGWSLDTVNRLDEVTDDIMERIEDPSVLNKSFDRKGLVVGYVQSGKTANFTGLINKSIDSGYKIIIVLSGLHKNLRSQTQMRIDEEVIGRDTSDQANVKRIGVSTLINEKYINIDTFTTQDDKGDFNRTFAQKLGGIQPGSDRPMLFVIKKNSSVLKNLIRYFNECISTLDTNFIAKNTDGKTILNNLPLLIIDDEADQASPNTRATSNDDVELDPTTINMCIRELLTLFNQKAYVGYTATPFANIFIDPKNEHSTLGKDLFPSSFIISMEAPSNYFGPVKVFGLNEDIDEQGLPIHIAVHDASQLTSSFLPLKHKSDAIPDHIPESMKEAIMSFIISSAIRRLRGHGNKHNTMLIHCTRFNDIQNAISKYVEEEFNRLREGLINDDAAILATFYELWKRDFVRVSTIMGGSVAKWSEVKESLKPAILKMERKPHLINGSAGDILDYKNRETVGLSTIAIGGDKLSRGLTLEGLTISYFTRASTLYDTLMQMGRWFGYRSGFEDLCRIYTTPDLFGWYRHISTAFEILRKEFIEMSRQKSTPSEFGLRVLSHPDMMTTNAMKMRHTTTLPLTYKGKLTETSTLSSEKSILINNYSAVDDFIRKLTVQHYTIKDNNYLWKDVSKNVIVEFLDSYISYRGAPASNTKRIIEFIEGQNKDVKSKMIVETWNVSLMSLKRNDEDQLSIGGLPFKPHRRSLKEEMYGNRLFVKRIPGSSDEKIDFNEQTELTSHALRATEPRLNRPLLMIYPLIIGTDEASVDLVLERMPFGFAISWPNNNDLKESTYDINRVYQELEFEIYD